jgi:hypothetical protein
MLKKQVFDLVHTTSPSERVYVQDIDDTTDLNAIEVAIGVGIQERLRDKGYTALSRGDIVRDVLFNNGGYRADQIVRDTLPELLKKTKYVPVFKYLKAAQATPKWDAKQLDQRIVNASKATIKNFRPTSVGKRKANAIAAYNKDFSAYANQNDPETVVNYAGLLPEKALKASQLHDFLTENIALLDSERGNVVVNFYKLVCMYDVLQFGQL